MGFTIFSLYLSENQVVAVLETNKQTSKYHALGYNNLIVHKI